jgi:hypothetical protein
LKGRAALIRSADPELRTLVTTNLRNATENAALEAIDVIVPVLNHMHDKPGAESGLEGNQRAKYDSFLASGPRKQLWWRLNCMSHGCGSLGGSYFGGWPTYVIDATGVQNRAMQWLAFSYQVGGELYFQTTQRLSDAWTDLYAFGGNGEGTLLYPGKPSIIGGSTDVPLASYRLKMIREGLEDYEYLMKLSQLGDAKLAHQVAAGLFPTPFQARQPAAKLREARELVASRIVELLGGPVSTCPEEEAPVALPHLEPPPPPPLPMEVEVQAPQPPLERVHGRLGCSAGPGWPMGLIGLLPWAGRLRPARRSLPRRCR